MEGRASLAGAVLAGALWGLSGTAAQALFQIYAFPPVGLVTIRTIAAGVAILLVLRPSLPKWREHFPHLLILAVFGIVGSQLGYLVAIQYSNAPTGALLQFLFLPIVAGYEALRGAFSWTMSLTTTLVFATAGTILLIGVFPSQGSIQILITPVGLFAGLFSAVTGAYYTLASKSLVREKGSWWLVTWGFIIGGIVSSPFGGYYISKYSLPSAASSELAIAALVSFVVIFGTILSFGLYLGGLRRLTATETGVAASLEPITAAIAAYLFLGVQLTIIQYVGGALIILAVILISLKPPYKQVASANASF